MTYIGIGHRESRPPKPKGSQTQRSGRVRRKEDTRKGKHRQLEVDCGDFTFAVFFFSFGQKQQRKRRGGAWNVWESSRASLRPHKNKMAVLIKKRSLMLVSGTGPRASQARKRRRHSSASPRLLWGHVSHSETSHPEMYSHNKERVKSVRLFIWRAINRKAWKGWKWTQAGWGRDARRLFCSFYSVVFYWGFADPKASLSSAVPIRLWNNPPVAHIAQRGITAVGWHACRGCVLVGLAGTYPTLDAKPSELCLLDWPNHRCRFSSSWLGFPLWVTSSVFLTCRPCFMSAESCDSLTEVL